MYTDSKDTLSIHNVCRQLDIILDIVETNSKNGTFIYLRLVKNCYTVIKSVKKQIMSLFFFC
jgi:hypothetical protein